MMRPAPRADAGFTLAELIIYMMLLILMLGIGATLLIRTITVQRDTMDAADANEVGQLAFKEIETDIRNAEWATIGHAGSLLVLQTVVADSATSVVPRCVGYYVSPGTGELRRTVLSTNTQTHEALISSTSALDTVTADWSPTRDGFAKSGSRAFGTVDGVVAVSKLVSISMEIETGNDHKPVKFNKSVALRPKAGTSIFCG
ncbi:PulJ/GspJ family protein [Demequina silvatica]|uniref:PulJ/GspJ family protein n=1 Tax=Demequina silvatica TaxID=1638988 RepID=UPI0007859B40|nr:hypothetical protein [Demequina silvatica]